MLRPLLMKWTDEILMDVKLQSIAQRDELIALLQGEEAPHSSQQQVVWPMDQKDHPLQLDQMADKEKVVFPPHAVIGFVANAAVGALAGFLMKIKDHVLVLAVLEKVHDEVEVAV